MGWSAVRAECALEDARRTALPPEVIAERDFDLASVAVPPRVAGNTSEEAAIAAQELPCRPTGCSGSRTRTGSRRW